MSYFISFHFISFHFISFRFVSFYQRPTGPHGRRDGGGELDATGPRGREELDGREGRAEAGVGVGAIPKSDQTAEESEEESGEESHLDRYDRHEGHGPQRGGEAEGAQHTAHGGARRHAHAAADGPPQGAPEVYSFQG